MNEPFLSENVYISDWFQNNLQDFYCFIILTCNILLNEQLVPFFFFFGRWWLPFSKPASNHSSEQLFGLSQMKSSQLPQTLCWFILQQETSDTIMECNYKAALWFVIAKAIIVV